MRCSPEERTPARRPGDGHRPRPTQPHRLTAGGLIDRTAAAALHLRRPRMTGLRRRHARLGAARQRRAPRRALVQVPPAARHSRGRARGAERARRAAHRRAARAEHARDRRSSSTTGSRRAARTAGRRSRFDLLGRRTRWFSPVPRAGFYYKTFMWPAAFWEKLYEPLIRRAAGLGRAAGADRPGPLREGLRLLRRAGDRRRSGRAVGGARGRPRRRARHPVRGGLRARRPPACRSGREIDGSSRHAWAAARRGGAARACRRCASCRAPRVFGAYDHGTYGAVERVTDHLAAPPRASSRASALWRIVAKRTRARGGRDRAADGVRRQRPPGRHAGRRRAHLPQPLRRRARAPRGRLHDQRRRLAHGRRPRSRRRARSRPSSTPRAARRRQLEARAGSRARASCSAAEVAAARAAARRSRPSRCAMRPGAIERIACDLLAVSGGWNPTLHLTCHLGGKPAWDETHRRLRAGRAAAAAWRSPARRRAGSRSPRRSRTGRGSAARRPPTAALPAPPAPAPAEATESTARRRRSGVCAGRRRQGLRRLPERRHRRRRRARRIARASAPVEHLKRYTTLGMATDQGKTSNVPRPRA